VILKLGGIMLSSFLNYASNF